ncbi:hypothetical protein [Luteirhabdus pelagi]|uniref:hypothetical protein n=1 Tax=Luteirhabdus pelagi TaxID=2792783 RepID=UPI00193A38B2|nr:hypothetical protein [Luteirhabdus pelagi]
MKLQPLRIEAGWRVKYNQFYEVDPVAGFEDYFDGSSLLMLENASRLKLIDVDWKPEGDLNGHYVVKVLNFLENFDQHTYTFDINPDWENPFLTHTVKSRLSLVSKLESLMQTLPIYEDPRMILKRGVVDELSESYRLALADNGISETLVKNILGNGGVNIQIHLLNHKDITRNILLQFAENGTTKKVRNVVNQKLKNRRFRQ